MKTAFYPPALSVFTGLTAYQQGVLNPLYEAYESSLSAPGDECDINDASESIGSAIWTLLKAWGLLT